MARARRRRGIGRTKHQADSETFRNIAPDEFLRVEFEAGKPFHFAPLQFLLEAAARRLVARQRNERFVEAVALPPAQHEEVRRDPARFFFGNQQQGYEAR